MAKSVKFPEAAARLFNRVFICMKCGAKNKADGIKVRAKKVRCRKCKSNQLRGIHKDKKA
jgi:ribosomal protein L40E